MNNSIKSALKLIIFLSIGLLIVYLLYNNLDKAYQEECLLKGIPSEDCSYASKIIEDFKSVKLLWILVIAFVFMLSNLFRALRWNQFLDSMGYKATTFNSLGALMVGYLANLAVPRIGEVVRAGTLSKNENIPVEKVMGTIVLDRVLDVISLLIAIGLAFIFAFNTFQEYLKSSEYFSPNALYVLAALGLIGLIGLFGLNRFLLQSKSENKIVKKLQSLWSGFRDGLVSIKKVKNITLLVFYSLAIWICYYLMTYLCFFAFAPTENLGPLAGLVVFVFGSLGIVFPSPGGMGSYQLLVTQSLMIYGVSEFNAFSFSNIVFFSINIGGNILFGLFFLLCLPIYNSRKA